MHGGRCHVVVVVVVIVTLVARVVLVGALVVPRPCLHFCRTKIENLSLLLLLVMVVMVDG